MLWQRLLFGALMILAMTALVVFDAWLSSESPSPGLPVPPKGPTASTIPADELVTAPGHHPATGAPPRPWNGLPVAILAVLLVTFGTLEAGALLRSAGLAPPAAWSAFVGAGLCLIPWVEMMQQTCALRPLLGLGTGHVPLTVLWLSAGLLGSCLIVMARPTTDRAFSNMAAGAFLFSYLGLMTSFVVRIRCLDPGPAGSALFIYFVITVKMSDIGAYFIGMAFGRNRLAPVVSPGKTVEGFIGACLLAGLAGVLGWWLMGSGAGPQGVSALVNHLAPTAGIRPGDLVSASPASLPRGPYWLIQAIVFGILMAIMGHVGDLVESAWKRDLGAKDSARVIPSFGGVLDIIDSPVLAAPVAWVWFTAVLGMG